MKSQLPPPRKANEIPFDRPRKWIWIIVVPLALLLVYSSIKFATPVKEPVSVEEISFSRSKVRTSSQDDVNEQKDRARNTDRIAQRKTEAPVEETEEPKEKSKALEESKLLKVEGQMLHIMYNNNWQVVAKLDEKKHFVVPSGVTRVLVEIGTNEDPDFLATVRRRPELFYIMLEPVTVERARAHCRSFGDRCVLFPAAAFAKEDTAVFHVGASSKCSSLLSAGTGCAASVRRLTVPMITVDAVLQLVPPHLDIELVSFDCQGVDLMAAAGLKSERHRVSYVFLECQDLPVSHPWFISPLGYSCGQAISCIREQWKDWDWRECLPNMGPREYNCIVSNRKHPLTAKIPQLKPTFNTKHPPVDMVFQEQCPASFAKREGMGNEAPKRTFSTAPPGCQDEGTAAKLTKAFGHGNCDESIWTPISNKFDAIIRDANQNAKAGCAKIRDMTLPLLDVPADSPKLLNRTALRSVLSPYVYPVVYSCLNYTVPKEKKEEG